MVPSGLIELIKQRFNTGVDQAGSAIGQTDVVLGRVRGQSVRARAGQRSTHSAQENPGRRRLRADPADLRGRAGAFVARYQAEFGPLRLPLLAGVLPLYGARHAAFLHNEVPGIFIPEAMRQRMDAAGADGPAEGVRLAQELLAELRGLVQGVYLMPPFGRYDMAAEVLDGLAVARSFAPVRRAVPICRRRWQYNSQATVGCKAIA